MKLFVPGRICLLGEHSDWAGGYRRINADVEKGYAIICGTNQGIYAEVEPHPNKLIITSVTPEGESVGPYEISMEPQTLLEEAQKGGFWSYAAGVAYQMLTNYHIRGLVINNYKTDLPIKKGLSSSAAICVLTARAFNRVYDLKMTVRGEMELAYQGEITTPSRCGRMDQGCAFGNRPVLMTFDGDRLDTRELRVEKEMHFVLVDLLSQKDTMEILNRLNRCYPFAEQRAGRERPAPVRADQQRHHPPGHRVVTEGRRASPGRNHDGSAAPVRHLRRARLPRRADRSRPAPCAGIRAAQAAHLRLQGRGLARRRHRAVLVPFTGRPGCRWSHILEQDLGLPAIRLTLSPTQKVRKAVIPAAGFGTRLFPASKATKKELFPVIDRDGIAKPAILLIVEEAIDAGIEEIIIIVQRDDLNDFRSFFNSQISIENFNKLPPHFKEYSRKLLEMGQRVSFLVQDNQEGFGHAVYTTRERIGDEPFLLMLGDHIYRSNTSSSCARQMVEAYNQYGTSVVGLKRTPEADISSFGVVNGVWVEEQRILNITEFAEKPTLDYARTSLHVPHIPEDEYLTVFGQYIIKPEIYDLLETNIRNNLRERGEFQLTSALDRLRQMDGFQGLMIDGRRFDIGIPEHYLETLQLYAQP